jgi:hypothetical protein
MTDIPDVALKVRFIENKLFATKVTTSTSKGFPFIELENVSEPKTSPNVYLTVDDLKTLIAIAEADLA